MMAGSYYIITEDQIQEIYKCLLYHRAWADQTILCGRMCMVNQRQLPVIQIICMINHLQMVQLCS